MTKSLPIVSVVIVSYNAGKTIVSCLESLRRQETDKGFEVIVVDSSDDGTGKAVRENFPEVQLHVFLERKYCGDARNFGVAAARGDIVAFIDADCVADKHWIQALIEAHQAPALAVGGSIANGNPESYAGWAAYFTEFSRWMPQRRPAWFTDIPTANTSYKKAAFALFGRFIEGTYCSDTEFHWRMKKKGHLLRFVPAMQVFHKNITSLRKILCHEFSHGRSFARVRVRYQDFSGVQRLLYAVLFPLIALKLFLQVTGRNLNNRIYLGYFLASLPLVAAGLLAWSLGEAAGYLKSRE